MDKKRQTRSATEKSVVVNVSTGTVAAKTKRALIAAEGEATSSHKGSRSAAGAQSRRSRRPIAIHNGGVRVRKKPNVPQVAPLVVAVPRTSALASVTTPDGSGSSGQQSNKLVVPLRDIEESASVCRVPPTFHEVWNLILQMRSQWDAPVDIMGCDKLGDNAPDPILRRFHHLVACFLSSQTMDQCTAACMQRLREFGLTPSNILHNCTTDALALVMKGVSFHNTKARNLKRICKILIDDYDSDIPRTYEDLCRLPGIGPKMALIVMSAAWGQVDGIPADVHVHRISNRLGWIKTKTPEESCVALAAVIPREFWYDYNRVLVGFGQQTCKAINPQCFRCLASDLCPSAQVPRGNKHNSSALSLPVGTDEIRGVTISKDIQDALWQFSFSNTTSQ